MSKNDRPDLADRRFAKTILKNIEDEINGEQGEKQIASYGKESMRVQMYGKKRKVRRFSRRLRKREAHRPRAKRPTPRVALMSHR